MHYWRFCHVDLDLRLCPWRRLNESLKRLLCFNSLIDKFVFLTINFWKQRRFLNFNLWTNYFVPNPLFPLTNQSLSSRRWSCWILRLFKFIIRHKSNFFCYRIDIWSIVLILKQSSSINSFRDSSDMDLIELKVISYLNLRLLNRVSVLHCVV